MTVAPSLIMSALIRPGTPVEEVQEMLVMMVTMCIEGGGRDVVYIVVGLPKANLCSLSKF